MVQQVTPVVWGESQDFERAWWGNCANTYSEETKQLAYAAKMGLRSITGPQGGYYPLYDLAGKSVVDIGGGPVSLLLKTTNGGQLLVVDPCHYPAWVKERYGAHKIGFLPLPAEVCTFAEAFDEAWIYNVLQHVQDPKLVVERARAAARAVRVFEWVGIDPYLGHPHKLLAQELDEWLGGKGTVTEMPPVVFGDNAGAYHGLFLGDRV